MPPALDLRGLVFGRLTAIQRSTSTTERKGVFWDCKCSCGAKVKVVSGALVSGNTSSCGCMHSENLAVRNFKHGLVNTPEYFIWAAMLDRCRNPSNMSWIRYGGRGISVCERWQEFSSFIQDMGSKPTGMSIDRINNDGDYEPTNCRWATKLEQANNTRSNRFIEAFGECKTLAEWVRDSRCAIAYSPTLSKRIKRGWDIENAITTPSRNVND